MEETVENRQLLEVKKQSINMILFLQFRLKISSSHLVRSAVISLSYRVASFSYQTVSDQRQWKEVRDLSVSDEVSDLISRQAPPSFLSVSPSLLSSPCAHHFFHSCIFNLFFVPDSDVSVSVRTFSSARSQVFTFNPESFVTFVITYPYMLLL